MLQYDPVDLVSPTPEEERLYREELLLRKPIGVSDEEFLYYVLEYDGLTPDCELPGWLVAMNDQALCYVESTEGRAKMRDDQEAFLTMIRERERTKH